MRIRLFLTLLSLLALDGVLMAAPRWQFDVRLLVDAEQLQLQACSERAQAQVSFFAAPRGESALTRLQRSSGQALHGRSGQRVAPDWRAGECLEAQIDLAAVAALDRYRLGSRPGAYWRSDPRLWLWRPRSIDPDSQLHLRLPAGWAASVPWAALQPARYRLGATPADWPASVVFGRFVERRIERPGGVLRVSVVPTAQRDIEPAVLAWIGQVADDLLQVYGRLPGLDTQVLVLPLPGASAAVPWGQVTRGGGNAVHLFPGLDADPAEWRADWTATHEFAHLLHPFLGDRGRWLGEGLASYYQNVLRARSGQLSPTQAWDHLRRGFARGRAANPAAADALEEASGRRQRDSTLRVYWSGAAYWLERDIALRAQGYSLDQALALFAEHHLPAERRWDPQAFIAELARLLPDPGWLASYHRYASARQFPDLPGFIDPLGAGSTAAPPAAAAIMRSPCAATSVWPARRPTATPAGPSRYTEHGPRAGSSAG